MNQSMNSLMNKLSDMYLDLDILLTDFDKAIANTVTIYTVYEGELGREYGEIDTYDEDGIDQLKKIYYRLEKILEG